jgi:hypothetical protein
LRDVSEADAHVLAKGLQLITRSDSSRSVQNQASSPLKHSVEESEMMLLGISQQRDDDTEASCFVRPLSLDYFRE